ncbi:hypothetical protein UPYG_G00015460 [Umbra pygmaea]|uniref:Uncharacterized protein n=1 Tax=Umbra pygmaea TaxID=75934 RepID=A0ABD0XYA5_UMBPY
MFYTRNCLHRRACQHKVVNNIELMITDAFVKANPHIKFQGSGGNEYTMSTAIDDMEAYTKLTDHVFDQILYSPLPDLAEAREILQSVTKQHLYRFVGQTKAGFNVNIPKDELENDERAIVDVISMHWGLMENNPMDHVRYYKKRTPDVASPSPRDQVTEIPLPERFAEKWIRVYYRARNDPAAVMIFKDRFVIWCNTHHYQNPMISVEDEDEIPPVDN